jgi:fermentation-respiration switch protein FrsA (DUF1100 family)
VRLHGWFVPAAGAWASEPKGTVLFLHGNAENVSTHILSAAWLVPEGYNLFAFDYRGFGLSGGEPTLDGVHQDARDALTTVAGLDGVDPGRVIVFGQSLGASVAIAAVADPPPGPRIRTLIIEGAFADYHRITREKLAEVWLTWPLQVPLSYTIDGGYRPLDRIAAIAPTPILIMHGEADRIVPAAHAHDLYAAAAQPKTLWIVPAAGHLQVLARPEYRGRLLRFLDETLPPAAGDNG